MSLLLLYCNASGAEMTDTFHDSLDGAVRQAEWELGVETTDWEVCK